MNTGAHPTMPMAEYLKLPAVSASLISDILDQCPRAAWFNSWLNPAGVTDTTDDSDRGTIAHSLFLEGDSAGVAVIDPNDHPAKGSGAIPDGWTNTSIRAARDEARAQGKIPVLKSKMAEIEAMVKAAQNFVGTLRTTEPAIFDMFQPQGGQSEVTMVWDEGGTQCKMRPDRISRDNRIIVNFKTTSASVEPDRWGRNALLDFVVGAAWYQRGIEVLYGIEDCAYVFLVQEANPPYLCSLVGLTPQHLEIGHSKRRAGLKRWQQCVASNTWPGYPNRVAYPELPVWEIQRWEEKQLNDPAIAYGSQA